MKKIMFWGADILDRGLEETAYEALCQLMEPMEEAECYFVNSWDFSDLCLEQVQQLKKQYPQKKITTVRVTRIDEKIYEGYDTVICPYESYSGIDSKQFITIRKRAEKWGLENTDILFCYFYESLHREETETIRREAVKDKLQIINIARDETRERIQLYKERLTERELLIFNAISDGSSNYKELGIRFGISSGRVRQIYCGAVHKIKWKLIAAKY